MTNNNNETGKSTKSFSLDSFGVLLSNAYFNILDTDSSLGLLQEYLVSDDTLLNGEMSTGQMVNLYRAITNRQKNNIHLLTQLISISNRNEQIKLLLAELTKIKQLTNTDESIPKLSPKAQAALLGMRKLMLEELTDTSKLDEDTPEDSE